MELNWNLLSIILLISAIIAFITALTILITPTTKKIRSLLFIKFGLTFLAITIFFDAFMILFNSIMLYKISVLLIIPTFLCFSIGINYTIKETYLSLHIIIILCVGVLLGYLAFQPGPPDSIIENVFVSFIWTELFWILSELIPVYMAVIIFYWGFRTWNNAPFLIKKEATTFFIGIIFTTIFPSITILFEKEFSLISTILCYIFLNIGLIIFVYAIIKEPKLLYILPFTVYRIIVKDKEGYPLFDHDWSESEINEVMFSGFINAVQIMSEEIMNIGGLVDINLEKGMLLVHESKTITVGLVTSKSSTLLRNTLMNFAKDFEQQFERQLKLKIRDTSKYEPAYLLIDKHFANFPIRIILSKHHPLLLSEKYVKIPFELANKLKEIFAEEKEYDAIKAEIIKSPSCVPEEFIHLYEDLKKEEDTLANADLKKVIHK